MCASLYTPVTFSFVPASRLCLFGTLSINNQVYYNLLYSIFQRQEQQNWLATSMSSYAKQNAFMNRPHTLWEFSPTLINIYKKQPDIFDNLQTKDYITDSQRKKEEIITTTWQGQAWQSITIKRMIDLARHITRHQSGTGRCNIIHHHMTK
jgi:hypothetical protein